MKLVERTRCHRISLADLLEPTLRPYAALRKNRVCAAGPDVDLEPQLALSLHMVFHELATNASKHGALSSALGHVDVRWELLPKEGETALALRWREWGGPEVQKPTRRGFGLRLVTKVLKGAEVELNFEKTGLICRMLVKLDDP